MSLSFCAVVFCGFDCVMAFLLYARWVQIPVRSVDEALQTITGMLLHDLQHVRFRVLQKYQLNCTYTDEWIRNWTKNRISRGKNSSYKGFPGFIPGVRLHPLHRVHFLFASRIFCLQRQIFMIKIIRPIISLIMECALIYQPIRGRSIKFPVTGNDKIRCSLPDHVCVLLFHIRQLHI